MLSLYQDAEQKKMTHSLFKCEGDTFNLESVVQQQHLKVAFTL
jgi:hypothetical protein